MMPGATLPESLTVAFITFFVVIDPVGLVPMFAALTPHHAPAERRRIALRSVVIAGIVLVPFAFVGEPLLNALGITVPAFRIAGGILLLLLAIDMVMVRQSGLRATIPSENDESVTRADVSVFPLAIPLIAGPGAFTTVVILAGGTEREWGLKLAMIGVLVGVLGLTLVCFLATEFIVRLLGVTGINVLTRVLGILLAALAVQFIVDGVLQVWPGTGL